MKTILFIFIICMSFITYSKNDSTKVSIAVAKYNSELDVNESLLEMVYFTPEGKSTIPKDIILIIENDTFCYNSINLKDTLIKVPSGQVNIEVRSKWWQSKKVTIGVESQTLNILHINFGEKALSIPKIEYSYDKPVIYFYPEKEQQVDVKLNVNGELGFTYPNYNNGWTFIAKPNGNLSFNNSTFKYLFWEAKIPAKNSIFNQKEGFIVSSDSLLPFFEHTLSKIGLTDSEQQDFITYWYPLMKENDSNFIHFIFNDDYNNIANLEVTPKPKSIIRLFMFWKKIESNISLDISSQNIPEFSRKGFSVVEWGGTEIPNNDFNLSEKN